MDTDVVFESLSHQYRRNILRYLSEHEETTTLGTVAEQIGEWEANGSHDAISDEQHQQILTSLYHTHIPKLVDAGVVEFDEEREQITATRKVHDLYEYLELWE